MSRRRARRVYAELLRIRGRRAALRAEFDIARDFRELEESCVPSYCHPNPLAAAISWFRLLIARALYLSTGAGVPVLDFGASTGELFHLLPGDGSYHFVEGSDALARTLSRAIPAAKRERLDALPRAYFEVVFALDSLEHNDDAPEIIDELIASLRIGGRLIVSGPTENLAYRLGRRIAGFGAHCHHRTTIYEIERALSERLEPIERRSLPRGLPLFRISTWRRAG